MPIFVVYTPATGAIHQVHHYPDDAAYADIVPIIPSGLELLQIKPTEFTTNPMKLLSEHYVNANTLFTSQTMTPSVSATSIAANGTATSVITGLPDPCTVSISGVLTVSPTKVTGGSVTLTSDTVGTLTLSVSAPPAFLPWEISINAV